VKTWKLILYTINMCYVYVSDTAQKKKKNGRQWRVSDCSPRWVLCLACKQVHTQSAGLAGAAWQARQHYANHWEEGTMMVLETTRTCLFHPTPPPPIRVVCSMQLPVSPTWGFSLWFRESEIELCLG
jgi:hypothetical protein